MSLQLRMPTNRSDRKRREARARVAMEARIETLGGSWAGFVLNLSCHGAMVKIEDPPAPRSTVILKCGPIDAIGSVAWVEHERLGIAFDESIDEEDVVYLRRLADESARLSGQKFQGRPSLMTRPLTAEEWQLAQEWGSAANII